ncbi:MAG: hypothetical protein IJA26_01035 [Clostridia bacterium]|nr:hypothetical protein [Clostridia bacterium]
MKKIICLLLTLLLVFSAQAFALRGSGYPAFDGTNFSENHMAGSFGSDALLLEFDPTGDYSFLSRESVQACFFAFDESESNYLELYLELPADIKSGDTISSGDFLRNIGKTCAITFYEVGYDNEETRYYAGSMLGVPYPDTSSFEISIDQASFGDTSVEVSGRLSASLIRFDGNTPTRDKIDLTEVQFHFNLPVGAAAITPQPTTPAPDAQPEKDKSPLPAINPAPAFTLPPDFITL